MIGGNFTGVICLYYDCPLDKTRLMTGLSEPPRAGKSSKVSGSSGSVSGAEQLLSTQQQGAPSQSTAQTPVVKSVPTSTAVTVTRVMQQVGGHQVDVLKGM